MLFWDRIIESIVHLVMHVYIYVGEPSKLYIPFVVGFIYRVIVMLEAAATLLHKQFRWTLFTSVLKMG